MSINFFDNIFQNKNNTKFAGSMNRSLASAIDVFIVLFLRGILLQILASLFLQKIYENFITDFQNKFGTDTPKRTYEHLHFFFSHQFFYSLLATLFIIFIAGALYYAWLNSSSWQATIGKRLMKIIMVDNNDNKISLYTALAHYFLSVLPFVFIFYLLLYQISHHLTFVQTVTASATNIFFGFVFVIWTQLHILTKTKRTAYDIICKTYTINGKTAAKFPWHK